MATSFQNRLVGSIVFVALIVIFLPDLLDGKKTDYGDQFQTIPARPKAQAIPAKPMFPKEEIEVAIDKQRANAVDENAVDDVYLAQPTVQPESQSARSEEQSRVAETVAETSSSEEVTSNQTAVKDENKNTNTNTNTNKNKNEIAWVIQLGSFRHEKNVKNLQEKLSREGYVTFTRPLRTSNGKLTKVYVGPDFDKVKLQAMLPDLKRLTNLSGKISIYDVAQ
ncbi:SPOR domain-containing protein [Catenovulum sediminis]|uniref:SPOR domain-containing protein n=1 Tax=Catenovulum sediminis TaxID=1740262 RepID=UPI001181632E|nr:SPOR domain-containing protein [Catenovulum sediminis]